MTKYQDHIAIDNRNQKSEGGIPSMCLCISPWLTGWLIDGVRITSSVTTIFFYALINRAPIIFRPLLFQIHWAPLFQRPRLCVCIARRLSTARERERERKMNEKATRSGQR